MPRLQRPCRPRIEPASKLTAPVSSPVYPSLMAPRGERTLNVTLDAESAAKLSRLAKRMRTPKTTLAGFLLSRALEEDDLQTSHAGQLLDGIPGAYERVLVGREQAKAGTTILLDDL